MQDKSKSTGKPSQPSAPTSPSSPALSTSPAASSSASTSASAPSNASSQPQRESPEITFRRLANRRVSKAINSIRLIENLSRYSHSDEQAAKIDQALGEAVAGVRAAFSKSGRKTKQEFTV